MSSQLNVDTIADKAGGGPVGLTKQVAAKSFCAWAFEPLSIADSLNISSQTDNGVGETLNSFTNAMAILNCYAANMTVGTTGTYTPSSDSAYTCGLEKTNTTNVNCFGHYPNGSGTAIAFDFSIACMTAIGYLA